jgi:glycosyltransferase involved in cell wall biosynthesis
VAIVVVVSFRLGGTDGVSIEAAKWQRALEELGHVVTTVAGEGVCDRRLPGLAATSAMGPSLDEMTHALGDADLVVVENLASLPLNVGARDVLYRALEGRAALFHHHDLAWQRDHLAHLAGPLDAPRWAHVAINQLSVDQLRARGIEAELVYNSFDCDPPTGERDATRSALGVGTERLAVMPTRALARKNVAGALTLCEALGAVLWLLGPSEDGYEPELERLLHGSKVRVLQGRGEGNIHDAYAASDLVVMPSTWEGFGNPVLESVTHGRPLAINWYPVALEIAQHGFTFFGLEEVTKIAAFLDDPDETLLARNLAVARRDFNVRDLAPRLGRILESLGLAATPVESSQW